MCVNHLKATIKKDVLHPDRLCPWISCIEGQLGIAFATWGEAMHYSLAMIRFLRHELEPDTRQFLTDYFTEKWEDDVSV